MFGARDEATLAQWIDGLARWATGSLRFVAWPRALPAVGYVLAMASQLRAPASWLMLAFFACPMLTMHFAAAPADLPAGLRTFAPS